MDFPHGEPITVVTRTRGTTRDSEGNRQWTETPSAPLVGAFDPAIGYETTGDRDQVVSQPQAYLPPGASVDSNSILVIRGKRYEVDGEPALWVNPFTGWQPGWQVPLKRATG